MSQIILRISTISFKKISQKLKISAHSESWKLTDFIFFLISRHYVSKLCKIGSKASWKLLIFLWNSRKALTMGRNFRKTAPLTILKIAILDLVPKNHWIKKLLFFRFLHCAVSPSTNNPTISKRNHPTSQKSPKHLAHKQKNCQNFQYTLNHQSSCTKNLFLPHVLCIAKNDKKIYFFPSKLFSMIFMKIFFFCCEKLLLLLEDALTMNLILNIQFLDVFWYGKFLK